MFNFDFPTLMRAILEGKGYSAVYSQTIGGAAQGFYALSVFNPFTSKKNLFVFSAKAMVNFGVTNTSLFFTSSDPALGTSITPINMNTSGVASIANATIDANSISFPGNQPLEQFPFNDVIDNDYGYTVTPGNGVEIFAFVGNSQQYSLGVKWLEL
jgi:hypothetical protein